MPIESTIKIIRGQDLSLKFSMDRPRSISGWTLQWVVFDAVGGTQKISKTTSSGITINDAARGIATVALARADTSSLTVTRSLASGKGYVWELARTDTGSHLVLARGDFILLEELI